MADGIAAAAAEEFLQLVRSKDAERIAEFAESHLWTLFNCAYPDLVAAVSALPGGVLASYPALQLLHPLIPSAARTTHRMESEQFQKYRGSKTIDPLLALSLQIISLRINGQISLAHHRALTLQEQLGRHPLASHSALESPLWFYHHLVGSTMFMAGNTAGALGEFASARQIGQSLESLDARYSSMAREALIHALRGSSTEAEKIIDQLRELPEPSEAFRQAASGSIDCAKALISLHRLDADLPAMVDALAPLDAVDVVWPALLLIRTRSALAKNQPHQALEAVSIAAAAHPLDPHSLAYDAAVSAQIEACLLLGSVEQAEQIAQEAKTAGAYTRVALIWLAVVQGKFKKARERSKALAAEIKLSPYHRVELQLLAAWSEYLQLGRVCEGTWNSVAPFFTTENRELLSLFPQQFHDQLKNAASSGERAEITRVLEGLELRKPISQVPRLTAAEARVLQQLATENSHSQMAETLGISPNTLKTQIRQVYRKLNATSRPEAVITGSRLGLVRE
ncbi:hypothetical protein AUR04nite_16850 [Glutamicibacter uratoxydans]|uniref:HTH luxR-type domain-containing protein n=1 Tax=Glutamicibacter uratoxydans TaxID=43667 RepID=A0A4Y4DNH7_GLUUR|nr:LuxR family transcriptional regulator [Glutamicibacter uratoxydans]GED06153.1 hypothetical protein AUR04nite_16850 [Glutamicibacter uratoxydans]